jgi:glycosyltransferase involved in cell wall biosynthesis
MGIRADVPFLLSQSDLFVLPSLWEGFPTVIMESMVCETAVIATDIPGTRELVLSEKNGWLVRPKDPKSLASAIIVALTHKDQREKMREQASRDVKQFFIDQVCKDYLRLYFDLYPQK